MVTLPSKELRTVTFNIFGRSNGGFRAQMDKQQGTSEFMKILMT